MPSRCHSMSPSPSPGRSGNAQPGAQPVLCQGAPGGDRDSPRSATPQPSRSQLGAWRGRGLPAASPGRGHLWGAAPARSLQPPHPRPGTPDPFLIKAENKHGDCGGVFGASSSPWGRAATGTRRLSQHPRLSTSHLTPPSRTRTQPHVHFCCSTAVPGDWKGPGWDRCVPPGGSGPCFGRGLAQGERRGRGHPWDPALPKGSEPS